MPVETWSRSFFDAPLTYSFQQFGLAPRVFPVTGGLHGVTTTESVTSYRTHHMSASEDMTGPNADIVGGTSGNQLDFYRRLRNDQKNVSADTGHDFFNQKSILEFTGTYMTLINPRGPYIYRGYVNPGWAGGWDAYPDPESPSPSQIATDGGNGFRQGSPTKKEGHLLQAILELRQDFPHIFGSTVLKHGFTPHSVGDEYLNAQFGVFPTLRDIHSVARSIKQISKSAGRFAAASGTINRRRVNLYDRESLHSPIPMAPPSSMIGPVDGQPMDDLFYDRNLWKAFVYDQRRHKSWFVGGYSYHVSEAHNFLGNIGKYLELADHALGLDYDIKTAYDLAPFSWLFDWFTDFGSFVQSVNLLSSDNLVLQYGYVMHEDIATRIREVQTPIRSDMIAEGWKVPSVALSTATIHTKRRTATGPYGFGQTSGFSNQQYAILGALGMTKAPGILK